MIYILLTVIGLFVMVWITGWENWPLGLFGVLLSSIYWPAYLSRGWSFP